MLKAAGHDVLLEAEGGGDERGAVGFRLAQGKRKPLQLLVLSRRRAGVFGKRVQRSPRVWLLRPLRRLCEHGADAQG